MDDVAPQGRLSILFRAILVIPHAIVLWLLGIAVSVVVVLAWFTVVIAGRFPEALLRFTAGYGRRNLQEVHRLLLQPPEEREETVKGISKPIGLYTVADGSVAS